MNVSPAKPSVAIVEDDADQLHSIEEFLVDAGYRAWGVGSAEAFYRRFMTEPVDVVILDIGLPGEDGLAVANLLRDKPDVAVIILSARDSLQERVEGLRAGADRYLVKPANLLELVANIDAAGHRLLLGRGTAVPATAPPAAVPAPPAAAWTLSVTDWTLSSPQGEVMPLTTHEYLFLQELLEAQGRPVAKRKLSDRIFGARVPNGSERLNLLVTRLRKKAVEAFAQPLPLKTLHQIGYAFTSLSKVVQHPCDAWPTARQ